MSLFGRFRVSPEKQHERMCAELTDGYRRTAEREQRKLIAAGIDEYDARRSAASTAEFVVRRDFRSWLLTEQQATSIELPWPRPGWEGWAVAGYTVRSAKAEPPIGCDRCGQAAHLFIAERDAFDPEWITDIQPDLHLDWAPGRFLVDSEDDPEFDTGYYYTLHSCDVPAQAPFAPFDEY